MINFWRVLSDRVKDNLICHCETPFQINLKNGDIDIMDSDWKFKKVATNTQIFKV